MNHLTIMTLNPHLSTYVLGAMQKVALHFFIFDVDDVADDFDEALTALKLRLLDGAPSAGDGGEDECISDEHFMSLLLLCALGNDGQLQGTEHIECFVPYLE